MVYLYNDSDEKTQRDVMAQGAAVYESPAAEGGAEEAKAATQKKSAVQWADNLGGSLIEPKRADAPWPELVTSEVEPQTAEVKPMTVTQEAAEEVEKRRRLAEKSNAAYNAALAEQAKLTPEQKKTTRKDGQGNGT